MTAGPSQSQASLTRAGEASTEPTHSGAFGSFSVLNAQADPALREVAFMWDAYDVKVARIAEETDKLDAPTTTGWWRQHRLRRLAHWRRRADGELEGARMSWVTAQLSTSGRPPTREDARMLYRLTGRPEVAQEEAQEEPPERSTPRLKTPPRTTATSGPRHSAHNERSEAEPTYTHPEPESSPYAGLTLAQAEGES